MKNAYGSNYSIAPATPATQAFIAEKMADIPSGATLSTTYEGQPVYIKDGCMYLYEGKDTGHQSTGQAIHNHIQKGR